MKTTITALPALALVLGFMTPASAAPQQGLALTKGSPAVVSQQSTCKEGETWNEDTKKCEKK